MESFNENVLSSINKVVPNLSSVVVHSVLPEIIKVDIRKTPFKALSVRILPAAGSLVLEIVSKTLDSELLSKIHASAIAGSAGKGASLDEQPSKIIEMIANMVENNMLLYCWGEIKQIKSDCFPTSSSSTLKVNEKSGTLTAHGEQNEYFIDFKVVVGDNYPVEQLQFELSNTNFPPEVVSLITATANNIARQHCERYVHRSRLGDVDDKNTDQQEELTEKSLQDIKHDVKFLKKVSDLNKLSDDKAMRREKRVLVRDETKKEQSQIVEQEQMVQTKGERALYLVISMVIKNFVNVLPLSSCPICKKSLLPPPNSSELLQKVIILGCSHWYHQQCITEFMDAPLISPESKICFVCKERIQTRKWNNEYFETLRKKWLKNQEKARELDDVKDFLGL